MLADNAMSTATYFQYTYNVPKVHALKDDSPS
jgi:hypothetical protein